MTFRLTFFILLLSSCGKMEHKVTGVPKSVEAKVDINVNDGFIRLYEFCDARYGYKTKESDVCIEDGKQFKNVKLGLDTKAIEDYCATTADVQACKADIVDFLSTSGF